jgi:hypothetical protein
MYMSSDGSSMKKREKKRVRTMVFLSIAALRNRRGPPGGVELPAL